MVDGLPTGPPVPPSGEPQQGGTDRHADDGRVEEHGDPEGEAQHLQQDELAEGG